MQTSLITEIFLGVVSDPNSLLAHLSAASSEILQQAILCTTFILNTAWDYRCIYFMLLNPVQK